MTRVAASLWDRRRLGHVTGQELLALAGIVAPIIFFIILIVAGLLRAGYNPISRYGSDLELGPNSWLQRANFILFGVLAMAFAVGLHRGINDGKGSRIGPVLIGVAGIAIVLEAIFIEPASGKHSMPGSIHAHASQMLSGSLIVAYILIALRLRRDRCWRGYALYSVIAAVLSFVLLVALMWGAGSDLLASRIGLVQRLHYVVLFGWLEVLALRLLTLRPRWGTAYDTPPV